MSRRIIRYLDGKPVWSDNEPAAARVQGHGGVSLGFFSGTVLTRKPLREKEPEPARRTT